MTKLNTINCEEIMTQPLKPIEFVVDNLITQGLFILAGAPKIGKSWLALDICLSVAKGEPVLNAKTAQGTALYLCLEDSKIRIQNRLYEMTDEPTEHLHFALIADTIGSGLEEQIKNFISEHQDTKIIFIDTLQKIRSDSTESTYATDYKELSVLKSVADKHSVAIVLVHHLRKTKDAVILSISLDTIYTKNFSKFSLLPHKYPRSVSGVDICAGASCGGTQCCMITPPFFSRRHAAYCRADSPIVPITHMTRRLEPMDRVKELGDASVPFEFDVHAMIFSEDAPALETILHNTFKDNQVNLVNPRKEFYNVSLDDIEKIVKENYNATVTFTQIAEAAQYRESVRIRSKSKA